MKGWSLPRANLERFLTLCLTRLRLVSEASGTTKSKVLDLELLPETVFLLLRLVQMINYSMKIKGVNGFVISFGSRFKTR